MSQEHDPSEDDTPPCVRPECEGVADFWLYNSSEWRPICERHALTFHPSLEIRVWLESGYMKPVELGEPDDPPSPPNQGREAAFREMIDEMMEWSE